MKDRNKGIAQSISMFGIFFGRWFSRNFGDNTYFGLNGRVLIGIIAGIIIGMALIILITKKFYFASFIFLVLFSPMIITYIGMYYDNTTLMDVGFVTFIIILIIFLIITKRYVRTTNDSDDNINYDRYKNKY
ncbi:hypothetical protein CPAST_c25690 [Clostridium pasteurianum DSM 525 = ATCC 6013]|uniref:Uncharacterized protein n=1 Tax=Clostridium pasteurianum DSM 525 = ATCC 6013 TaxID=1262449 RepID=A0A0H3J9C7_CLOPA|nr:hypothetical protein [Clostridium pasteurianum]AJA48638.1 hypothetical protein CPAST_c25690 [Clostridium pasteurianum DSM 525 = ATCC 6013]AJA52626.1 hypothetical protein CLPA_c25690 [Clostridium pasteurianum DSM 525 = ATCC 6013]AOZ75868.1 hypothetical protein AQ983_12485 [Clostridium pasteurianum DSM 525 = ATCC 6013]AOZ79664.1 hypothetical protein AQ984_12480 [Clostridium pasteurianum]ELP57881.1 hypothetical protein F502_16810 [Clostridium pasteurianum DSM 525 = ATCC 6013]